VPTGLPTVGTYSVTSNAVGTDTKPRGPPRRRWWAVPRDVLGPLGSRARTIQSAMPHAASAVAAVPRDDLLRIASPLRESIAAAPYEPPAGSSASVKSLLAALLPSASQSQPRAGKEAADLLFFCASVLSASPESPALHWVPADLSGAAAAATQEMVAAGGWDGVGEMVRAMMPEVVPALKDVVKESCVDAENDEIGAVKLPKEHAIVAAHQFRWLVSQVCAL
jgi:TELO2-interacting protein 2